MIIGRTQKIFIIQPDTDLEILAKVDSGSYSSSIDKSLFESLNLSVDSHKSKIVKSSHGQTQREFYWLDIIVKGVKITTELNIQDRSNLKYKFLLGRKDISQLDALVNVKLKDD